MSIYEKYHSEINRNNIYNIVEDILNKEYGIVLSDKLKCIEDPITVIVVPFPPSSTLPSVSIS